MKNRNSLNAIIKNIIRNKIHCYFISPHFDDAAFSAGGLISYLAGKVSVTVVNVFTKGDKGPYTLSSKAYLSRCGYKDANKLFAKRRKEDKQIFGNIGVTVINLGFTDGFWRKKEDKNEISRFFGRMVPELIHIYPTYKFHMGPDRISNHDSEIKTEIKDKLQELIQTEGRIIFCPVGIGKHIDHIIVRDVCSNTFDKLIYWSDFNYSMQVTGKIQFIADENLKMDYFNKELFSKRKLIEGYKSQKYAILPHGKIPILPDFYYL